MLGLSGPGALSSRKYEKGTRGELGIASQITIIKGFYTQALEAAPLANWP